MALLSVNKLTHRYDHRKTDGIQDVSFELKKGETLALIGPSGSGKTTTLKCISGKIPSQGIEFSEEVAISIIDQNSQLAEEKTVFENLEAVIMDINSPAQRENQIRTILSQLEITNEIDSLVKNLSGGQKQRVILAMALVTNPTLLLLDEPFANLDKNLRELLLQDLWEVFKSKDITVLWVTHNTEEALKYSDRIILLNFGEIQQIGTPRELFYQPANTFVAHFFGENNVLPATMVNKETYLLLGREIVCDHKLTHEHFLVALRPNFFTICEDSKLWGHFLRSYFLGPRQLIELEHKGQNLFIEAEVTLSFQPKQKIHFDFNPTQSWILDQ